MSFQESKKEETNKTNKSWKLKIGSLRREESAVRNTNGWDIIFITVTSKGAVLLISYDARCSELLQHGSQPHRCSGPELMHSTCRGFGGSSFSACASVPLEHFVLLPWTSAYILLPAFYNGSVWWIFYLYSQQMQPSEKNSARRRLSQLFRRRRKTLPV